MENTAYDEINKLMHFLRQKQESITFERQHEDLVNECKESDIPQTLWQFGIGLIEGERLSAYAYWRAAGDLLFYLYELRNSKKMLKLPPEDIVRDFYSRVEVMHHDAAYHKKSIDIMQSYYYIMLLNETIGFLKDNYPDIVNQKNSND